MADQEKKESDMEIFFVIGILFVVYWAINHFFGNQIASFYLHIKKFELWVIRLVYSNETLDKIDFLFNTRAPKDWKKNVLMLAGTKIFYFWAIIAYGIMGYFVYLSVKKGPMKTFNKKHNMFTLAQSQVSIWPWIHPVVNLNLIKTSIYEGKWAISKSVSDFVKSYNLLEADNTINANRATRLFVAQLGSLWAGVDKLRPYEKALLASFIAHGCNNKDEALSGLKSLALNGIDQDFSWADKLLKKHIDDPKIKHILNNYAYVTTVLCSALKFSRGTQVLPSSYFLWLKPINRALWYALNGVGRRVAFCEVAGIYSHWMAEEVAGHAIEKPYVKEAVDGLREVVKGIKFD